MSLWIGIGQGFLEIESKKNHKSRNLSPHFYFFIYVFRSQSTNRWTKYLLFNDHWTDESSQKNEIRLLSLNSRREITFLYFYIFAFCSFNDRLMYKIFIEQILILEEYIQKKSIVYLSYNRRRSYFIFLHFCL